MSHDVTVQLSECDVHLWLYERGSEEKEDPKRIEMAVLTQDDWRKLQAAVAEHNRWDE
jgi:hypothetical protein